MGNKYYPEMTWKLFIVNAPVVFAGIWKFVSIFMDKKTVANTTISSGSNIKKLLNFIDEDKLHVSLGGTCEEPLKENSGPWKEDWDKSFANGSFFAKDKSLWK